MVASSIPSTSLSTQNIPAEYRQDYVTFRAFIFKNKTNRNYLLIAAIATILQFIIFKIFYPYADFFSDSYSYIYGAQENLDINIWPIGYSWFLRYVHFISSSDTLVVAIQYFFVIMASLLFFFTIRYFFQPARNTSNIIFAFITFNPLFLYICNYINSDPLFAGLSLLWMTQLIWIIQRPQLVQIFTHGILLYLCFIVRNNAMIYPFISALAFFLSGHRKFAKVFGIGFGALLIILFINHQRDAARRLIGQEEFSLFTGWQLANNALYTYGHIDVDSTIFETPEAAELNRISADFYKNASPEFDDFLSATVANHFIRHPKAPLKVYYKDHFSTESNADQVKHWGQAGLVFKEFGSQIMKNYPVAYVRYFMLRNAKSYFLSPLEKLEVYNLGQPDIWPLAVQWFQYKSNVPKVVSYTFQGRLLGIYPILFMFINVCFVICLVGTYFKNGLRITKPEFNAVLLLVLAFYLSNLAFSLFTTMNVLRYQFFPMMVFVAFASLCSQWMSTAKKTKIEQTTAPIEPNPIPNL